MTRTRREFFEAAAVALLAPRALLGGGQAISPIQPSPMPGQAGLPVLHVDFQDPWASVPDLLNRIVPPKFANREFLITKYGARSGADASNAIAKAIDACSRAGGGRVTVPAGEFVTGPIRLKSRIELHVAAGAILKFSTDPARYPLVLTRWEGVELMNYSPLIYALECEDVAVTGEGTLDGQADDEHWWPWKGKSPAGTPSDRSQPEVPAPQLADRNALMDAAERGVPVAQRVFGAGHYLRPTFIEPYRCRNVLIESVTIRNAPFWNIHPTLSTNVTVRKVTVVSHGPNTDGCDPESCRGVLIEECVFDTGDDCIALKSGRNADGRRINVPIEEVVIRRCQMKDGHGGITIGSEITGGARNIFAEKCHLDSPNLERGLRIKTNTMRGGTVENVFLRDIEIGNLQFAPIEIDLRYEARESGTFLPVIRNIIVERMTSARSRYGLFIRGLEAAPVRNLIVRDSAFRGITDGEMIEGSVDLVSSNLILEAAPKKKEGKK